MTRLEIDRLEIRLKGIAPRTAQAMVAELGTDLLRQILRHETVRKMAGTTAVDKVDSGLVHVSRNSSPSELRAAISTKVSESVASCLRKER